MNTRKTFRQDLRQKFIFLALGPVLLLGILGGILVYLANEKTLVEEHNTMLANIDVQLKTFHDRISRDIRALRSEVSDDGEEALEEALEFYDELDSAAILDVRGKVQRIVERNQSEGGKARRQVPEEILQACRRGLPEYRGDAYYDRGRAKVLLPYLLRSGEKYFLFNFDMGRLFRYLRMIKAGEGQAIELINRKGEYILDTADENRTHSGSSFVDTGVYEIAVKHTPPYTLTEFPAHYRKGDSWWKGIFDEDHFLTYAPQKEFGWLILVEDQKDQLDPYLNAILLLLVPFLLLLFITVFVIVRHMTDRIMTPVERLIARIREAAGGRLDVKAEVEESAYPICKSLAESFNEMQKQIARREKALEEVNRELNRRVEEKTRSLQRLNEELEKRIVQEVEKNTVIQQRLAQSEKLAAMGEMIGNIAHQWRQPLSVISTLVTGIKLQHQMKVLEERELEETCDRIHDATRYLSQTIDDFRDFIRREQVCSRFTLRELMESFKNLALSQSVDDSVLLEVDSEEDLEIEGYRNNLIQILLNLYNNARDAIQSGGEREGRIRLEVVREEDRLLITVADNGGGIPQEILPRIFEPYFTTKEKSRGTGLGLHMVYRLVKSMGGEIQAENGELKGKKGAKFILRIPSRWGSGATRRSETHPSSISSNFSSNPR